MARPDEWTSTWPSCRQWHDNALWTTSPAYRYSDKRGLLHFSRVIMAAQWGHYIFVLWFPSSSSFLWSPYV